MENPAIGGEAWVQHILADINRFCSEGNSPWTVGVRSAICLFLVPGLRHVEVDVSTQFEVEVELNGSENV
jgi:hypothetical protein